MERCGQDLERATKYVAYVRLVRAGNPFYTSVGRVTGREELPNLGESCMDKPLDRNCAFRRGLQAEQNQGNSHPASLSSLSQSPASDSPWPNPTRNRKAREPVI